MIARLMLLVLGLVAFLVIMLSLDASARAQNKAEVFQIGMMDSLFDEVDEQTVLAQIQPFADLVRKQTGLRGEFSVVKGPDKMRADLQSGKLAIGVVLGLDYAWLREGCPEAEPLLIAVNETATVRALLLVRKDNMVKTAAELKGKPLALPRKAARFLRLYLDREFQENAGKFFQLKTTDDTDAAIEAVVEGEAEATVVTSTAVEVYRSRKPGRYNRLKVLQESIEFPSGAVIHIPGKTSAEDAKKFRDSMLKSQDNAEGRQTLTLWKLTGFLAPPADFVKKVDELGKKYPRLR